MKQVIVQYRVKSGRGDENQGLIEKVFEELHSGSPDGLRYVSFRSADGLSFTHIASIETDDGSNPLGATAAFKAFQAEIKDRCDEPPQATEVSAIGSYRFLDD